MAEVRGGATPSSSGSNPRRDRARRPVVRAVNTHGTATKPAMVVYTATKTAGTHSLVVNVLGTAGHARVDADAFLVIG